MKEIKLEVGKKYRNRRNEVVKIVYKEKYALCDSYYFIDSDKVRYRADGSDHLKDAGAQSDIGLIEEVIDDPAKNQHKNAEFIKAWADGIPLQKRYPLARNAAQQRSDWHDFEDDFYPNWEAFWIEYRIKPATKPDVIEFYIKMSLRELEMQGSYYEWVSENGKKCTQLKVIWDGETGKPKSVMILE